MALIWSAILAERLGSTFLAIWHSPSFQPRHTGHDAHERSEWTDCSRHRLRGGSWASFADEVRSANRGRAATGDQVSIISFRVGRTLNQQGTRSLFLAYSACAMPVMGMTLGATIR